MIDVKVSKDKYISRWCDWEYQIYVRWNGIKIYAQRQTWWSTEKKEAKSIKNTNKNPQKFLKISSMQKDVPPSHKMQDNEY